MAVSTGLTKVVLVSFFLAAGTFVADRMASRYLDKLIFKRQFATWDHAVEFLDTSAALLLILQMLIIMAIYWRDKGRGNLDVLSLLRRPTSFKPLLWGVLTGVLIYLAAFPFILWFDKDVQFVRLLSDDIFSLRTLLLVCLLWVIVPVVTEIVFRGIIFDILKKELGLVAALIASSLLFAYVWSLFDSGTALLLGLASGFLYHRFHQLWPGIIASAAVTILATLTLFLTLLYGTK